VLLLGLGAFAWRNLCAPRWGRRRFRVESVTPEARGIWTLKLSPVDGALFRHLPGQFVFLTLLRAGLPAEEHPFTISSSPSQVGFIAATIKELGNYTRTVGLTRAGDGALVEGPFGRFCHLHHDAERFLFISGGVGCTPVASMLRFMRDTVDHRQALYLCANRTEVDIAFREEFDRLPASMKVVHVLSDPGPGWRGARGRLDAATLQRLAGAALARADVLLCGPTQFMAALRGSLRGLGVPSGRIHTERFTVR
jgi:ferredoxin-NADP reductase